MLLSRPTRVLWDEACVFFFILIREGLKIKPSADAKQSQHVVLSCFEATSVGPAGCWTQVFRSHVWYPSNWPLLNYFNSNLNPRMRGIKEKKSYRDSEWNTVIHFFCLIPFSAPGYQRLLLRGFRFLSIPLFQPAAKDVSASCRHRKLPPQGTKTNWLICRLRLQWMISKSNVKLCSVPRCVCRYFL